MRSGNFLENFTYDEGMDTPQELLVLSSIAAVLSAIAAWWGIVLTVRDNRARSQPMLVAEFQYGVQSRDSVQLIIRNAGATPARNVEVSFSPPIKAEEWGSHKWMIKKRYAQPLPTLAPGQELRSSWWLTDYRVKDAEERLMTNLHGLPSEITVTFNFTGLGKKRHKEIFELDIVPLLLETFPVSSSSVLGRLGGIENQLRLVADSMKAVNTSFSHINETHRTQEE